MATSDSVDTPPNFQRFEFEDDEYLHSLPTQICPETGRRYILWSHIQSTFPDFVWMRDQTENIVLFMTDEDGELCHPLRIQSHLDQAFTLIFDEFLVQQSEGLRHYQQDNNDTSIFVSTIGSGQDATLSQLFEATEELSYRCLNSDTDRITFQHISANARHYQTKLLEEIEKKERAGAKVMVDGKNRIQIMDEIREYEEQMPQANYENICRNTLLKANDEWNTAISRLFIVLPYSQDSWAASDPTTHQFRLYFLCEFWDDLGFDLPEAVPQHAHISNHPGYTLSRPLEFLLEYGDYVLRILELIKRGYPTVKVPPLDTFEILWGCDFDTLDSHLSKETIGPLINKTVEYIQDLSPRKWHSNLRLTYSQSVAIKSYLELEDGDDAGGNLYRNIDYDQRASWICQTHKGVSMDQGDLQELQEFVDGHEGLLDIRQATISVNLDSESDSDRFCTLLTGTRCSFDIFVNLKWNATPIEVAKLSRGISKNKGLILEIDGVSTDIYPQDHIGILTGSYFNLVKGRNSFKIVTLLNFPRHQEHFLYIGDVELRLNGPPKRPLYNWMELESNFTEFEQLITTSDDAAMCEAASMGLQSELAKRGLTGVLELALRTGGWVGVFDLKAGVFVEVVSVNTELPPIVASTGSIPKIAFWLPGMEPDQELWRFIQEVDGIRKLEVCTDGYDVLSQVEVIASLHHLWDNPLHVTLFEFTRDVRGRIVIQMTFSPQRLTPSGKSVLETHHVSIDSASGQELEEEPPVALEISRWDRDHVVSPSSDYYASFLDTVTQQHPSVLTSFNLDVSACSNITLASIQNIVSRSSLQHLVVKCVSFDPTVCDAIVQILQSIQWSALQSLVLTGDNIDGWLYLWPYPLDSSLLRLHVQGAGPTLQELSHPSVLFIHHLASACLLSELEIENILLEDKHDWVLIVESMDPSLLESFRLCGNGSCQLLESAEATDHFLSILNSGYQDAVDRSPAYQSSFYMDIAKLSVLGLLHAAYSLKRSHDLDRMYISCTDIEPNLFDYIAQALDSVPWATLKSLELYGDNIDEWIGLCDTIAAPRLHSLEIRGTGSTPQELSHSSTLFLQRLLASSSLETLRIDNVILQDKNDWIPIIERVDSSTLKKFNLCEDSLSQLQMCRDAADLYDSKFPPIVKEDSDSE